MRQLDIIVMGTITGAWTLKSEMLVKTQTTTWHQ